jgi:hypothetical protein
MTALLTWLSDVHTIGALVLMCVMVLLVYAEAKGIPILDEEE